MTEHATCKCGAIVPPDKVMCELCGMREQLGLVVAENGRLRQQVAGLMDENAGLRREMARRESRP